MGYSGRSRVQELSFSQSRLRLGCFCGTFSPSRRHIRSTPFDVYDPTCLVQHRGDATIAISAILDSERCDVGSQCRVIIWGLCDFSAHVERCWPRTWHARRSETPNSEVTCSTQARRRAGLRSFPGRPPQGSSCPESDRKRHTADEHSRPPAPSGASPGRPSSHRILCVNGNM